MRPVIEGRSESLRSNRAADSFFGIDDELVAETADGEEMAGLGGVAFDVAAETNDEIVDGAGVGVFVEIPDILKDCFAGDGFAGAADEVTEEFGFHERELESLLADFELKRFEVEGFPVEGEFFGSRRRGGRCCDAVLRGV